MIATTPSWKIQNTPRFRRCISRRTLNTSKHADFESRLNYVSKFTPEMHLRKLWGDEFLDHTEPETTIETKRCRMKNKINIHNIKNEILHR